MGGGGGGGRGLKNFPPQTFFLIYGPLQTFFFSKTNFFRHIVFASNLFRLFRPCKHFFQYF